MSLLITVFKADTGKMVCFLGHLEHLGKWYIDGNQRSFWFDFDFMINFLLGFLWNQNEGVTHIFNHIAIPNQEEKRTTKKKK